MHMYVEARGWVISSIFIHLIFLRGCLSLNLEHMDLAMLVYQRAQWIIMSLALQCWDYRQALPCLAFYIGVEELNSRSHTYRANALLTEPSILPPKYIPFLKKRYLIDFYSCVHLYLSVCDGMGWGLPKEARRSFQMPWSYSYRNL